MMYILNQSFILCAFRMYFLQLWLVLSIILLTFSFVEHKFLILMKSGLSIISSMNCVFFFFHLKVILKVIYFFFMLSTRCLPAQHFAFRFVIHFEWIFVKGLRSVSIFIFWTLTVYLLLNYLLKRLSSPHCIAFAPSSKMFSMFWGSVSGLYVTFHWSIFLFYHWSQTVLITIVL